MAHFAYKVKSPNGQILNSVMESPDQRTVIDKLRGQKYIILEIDEVKANPLINIFSSLNPFKPKVKANDLVLFSRQLSTLINAGVPIVQGLGIITEQIQSACLKKVVEAVREDIEGGISISDALKHHPDAFSELYVSMVKAGEVGGILDVIMERLSAYLEAAEKLRGKVKGAMVYPAVVSFVAVGVTVFLLTVVIPTFKEIFEGFGAELPIPTQILISISDILRNNIIYVLTIPVVLLFLLRRFYRTESGKKVVDTYLLRLPVLGVLFKKIAVAKFTRTLGTLVKSGVPILQSLDTVAKTAGNRVIEEAILQARESIREGERIADPLKKSGIFPPMVIQMISVGEETGNLDTMLTKIADFYDQEVDVAIQGLTSMIEPLIIVVMGIVIGAIVIAMFMPMFELGGLAAQQG